MRRAQSWLHPLSGLAVLGLDWTLFGTDLLSGFTLTALGAVAGFCCALFATYLIQRRLARDPPGASWLKAAVSAVLVGVPFPVGGTLLGGWVLAVSGLGWLQGRRGPPGGSVSARLSSPRDSDS